MEILEEKLRLTNTKMNMRNELSDMTMRNKNFGASSNCDAYSF